ncbi:methyltransferase domain-containing protein [Acidobacteria bacterium AB60]|nr:methyltransferase domain-containing protein [Acidobacteria bacterium AB60]
MAVSPARKAAFNILLTLERGHAHSDELLRGRAVSALSSQDRNLATALVLGVLRWQLQLDEQFRPLLKRPNAKLDPQVLIALRLAAFQLLHLDRVPASAAIDESVELTKQSGHRFASGMVNAVLRKLAASPRQSAPAAPAAYPDWMRDRWQSFFGPDQACSICDHGQVQPVTAIRIPDAAIEDELQQAGIGLAPGVLLTRARIVEAGDVTATTAFREGRVRIQDEGSQLMAEIAGQASRILDCCAAPGGKTLILAERNPDARIVACEANPQRLESLRSRLAGLGERVEFRLADATTLAEDSEYDLVLADVPCSGTGTLGRNPEIRHRLQRDDLARQAERQKAIVASAVRAARPGARVLYSTCSLEPEENEQVIGAILGSQSGLRILPIGLRLASMRDQAILTEAGLRALQAALTPEGYLRLFPGIAGTDGFFIAMLEKLD